jgi:hypothetical protein
MSKMFLLRLFFDRFRRRRLALSGPLQRLGSACELPLLMLRSMLLRSKNPTNTRPSNDSTIRIRTIALVFSALVLMITFGLYHYNQRSSSRSESPFTSLEPNWQSSLDLASSSAAQRPVFPYSIIPGGVIDAHELHAAAGSDPVVADHYSDFQISQARAIRLTQPVAMYVSYRRANRVYWTKNRVVIPAGETVLSDGTHLARVRCGNRLSPVKASPVAQDEPPTEKLETPQSVPPLMAQLLPGEGVDMFPGPTSAIPALPASGAPIVPATPPPGFFPPVLGPGVPPFVPAASPPPPPPPPVSTPEPAAFTFLAVGAALLSVLIALRRK